MIFHTDLETIIGNVEVKSRSVHFYLQRNTSSVTNKGILRFELARLNVGGAMNLSTGIFTVPLNGIYHFDFSGVMENVRETIAVYLQVKASFNQVISAIGTNYVTGVLTGSFRLKQGDRVNLYKDKGTLLDKQNFLTHFTGWLVEEDLNLA